MWQIKALGDALKMLLPLRAQLRRLKRRLSPYRAEPAKLDLTISQGLGQIACLRAHGARLDGVVLEIGSGWFPVLPLIYLAAGARRVILTDIERLLDGNTLEQAQAALAGRLGEVAAALRISTVEVQQRIANTERLDYRVPFDPRSLPAASIDIVISRAVLEHVPPDELKEIFSWTRHVLAPGGVTCHTIDNSDHFEHQDKSISRVNFLRYDERLWRLTGINPQTYTNRFRHSDYVILVEDCDWALLEAQGEPDAGALEALKTLPLARRFRGRPAEDLAILESVILATPSAHGL